MEKPMERQYGFYFDSDRCVQCHACEVACKSWNELELGMQMEEGGRSLGRKVSERNEQNHFTLLHALCKTGLCRYLPCESHFQATRRRNRRSGSEQVHRLPLMRGSVPVPCASIRTDRQHAESADFCIERLEQGKQPSCVATCPGEALKCGPLDGLVTSAGKPTERLSSSTSPVFPHLR